MKRRIISVVTILCMIISFCPIVSKAAGTANDLLNVAYGECDLSTGYKQQEFSGCTKYGEWLGVASMDWCAAFVAWCANQAGISSSVVPHYSYVNDMINFYSNRGLYKTSGSYTPKAGDLAFLADFQHVAIVISATSTSVTTIEGNTSRPDFTGSSLYVSIKTRSMSYFKGFATPAYVDYVGAPSNPRLAIYTDSVAVGTPILFEYSVENAANMYIAIDVNGVREHFIEVWGDHYNGTFTKPGRYEAYLYATNSYGNSGLSNCAVFYVYDTPPNNTQIILNKNLFPVGTDITFQVDAEYANEYQIAVYKGSLFEGERMLTSDRSTNSTFSVNLDSPGEYYAYASSFNAFGYNDSYPVEFEVYNLPPTNCWIKSDKTRIKKGESITFSCGAETAEGYTVGIDKDGVRICTEDVSDVFTKTFEEEGNYTAYITAFNNFGYQDSSKISFEVYDENEKYIKTTVKSIDNTHTVNTILYNINNKCDIVIAGYKNDILENISVEPCTEDIFTTELNGEFDVIKVMVWDSLSGMKPICEAVVIPSSEFIS